MEPDRDGREPAGGPPVPLTLAEAAKATGLTAEAIRKRISRGRWQGFRSNDGSWRVMLSPAQIAATRGALVDGRTARPRLEADRDGQAVAALEAAIAALREAAGRDAAELARLHADLLAAVERAAAGEARAASESEARQRAEAEAAELRRELEGWSAGGPIARALRAAFWRRI